MVLFILIYGLPFALVCRFTGFMVALFGLFALTMVIAESRMRCLSGRLVWCSWAQPSCGG